MTPDAQPPIGEIGDGHEDDAVPGTAAAPVPTSRVALVAGAVLLLVLGAVGYVWWADQRVSEDLAEREESALDVVRAFEESQPRAATAADPPDEVEADGGPVEALDVGPGDVVVVNRVPGESYEQLAIRRADGTRELVELSCLRVHIAAGNGVCLRRDEGIVPSFTSVFFSTDNLAAPLKSHAVPLPSRVRVSPDGTQMSSTHFLTGSSYVDIGGATTTVTYINGFEADRRIQLEQFEVTADDERYDTRLPKYWGISFLDEDAFYVTGLYGDQPEVMYGSVDRRTLTPTGLTGSCPSISPSGATLVFKEQRADGGFDLVAVDIETEERTVLNESRSVDDQVEWLDEDTILYALHAEGSDETDTQPLFDIWSLDIASGATPELFLPAADSPAVIR